MKQIDTTLSRDPRYPRLRWGSEPDGRARHGHPCPDCGVTLGVRHLPNCDQEQCPACHAQALTCNCEPEPISDA